VIRECYDFTNIIKTRVLDGYLYLLGKRIDYQNTSTQLAPNDFAYYQHPGRVLARVPIQGGDVEIVYENAIETFDINTKGEIVVFAHDSDNGYYFSILENGVDGNATKYYCSDIIRMFDFVATENGILFIGDTVLIIGGINNLRYLTLEENMAIADVMPNVPANQFGMHYVKGFTYYYNEPYKRIERIQNSVYVHLSPEIKLLSCLNMQSTLFSSGYQVTDETVSQEEFALIVLSNDKKYDVCYLSSDMDMSHNLRDKGSFYPLNEVPGVMQYLDRCFPYVKEAATDENGDIWMLPIMTSIEVFQIQKENCEKEGIMLWEAESLNELVEMVEGIDEHYEHGKEYLFNNRTFSRELLRRYFLEHLTADTRDFRELVKLLKRTYQIEEPVFPDWDVVYEYTKGNTPNFLFSTSLSIAYQNTASLINSKGLSILPTTGSEKPYVANCIFLTVNPNSDNLNSTLQYITALSGYLSTLQNSGFLSDFAYYTDTEYIRSLYETYQDAIITFQMPWEIYLEDFGRYVNDEIDLEELVREVDRKLDIYLNE
jgi:hypothetical protein